jgi:hypothetical protein
MFGGQADRLGTVLATMSIAGLYLLKKLEDVKEGAAEVKNRVFHV